MQRGKEPALPLILGGLERLEYRGYDSAGVALIENGKLIVEKRVGKMGKGAGKRVSGESPT
ncbi:MAG: hypothetical protein Q9N34_08090 [Aquificota bacterium]|nr:hypothetical protein [Aquificota bacterium]